MKKYIVFAPSLLGAATPALVQEPQAISIPASVQLETGDSWTLNGQKYRLYGVQACLRQTEYVAPDGRKADCGLSSLSRMAAILQTGTVACQPIGPAKDGALFVVCGAELADTNIDVGTALIASGYAFAATYPDGKPVNTAYLVAELTAEGNRDGLWAGSFSHPMKTLLSPK